MNIRRDEIRPAVAAVAGSGDPAATYYCITPSPLGELLLAGDGERLSHLYMETHGVWPAKRADWRWDEAPFRNVIAQLRAYFAGELKQFDVPLAARGTEFQQRVWQALLEIPYGVTTSYGELARRLGDAKASRAVGLANGRNPVSIIVPCHRVIGADGSLTGYGGGLDNKLWLLRHEGAMLV
ncbi:MAG: methylated-DNA--[protein]-cysteine S-methyltransferase [Nevskia sp.]